MAQIRVILIKTRVVFAFAVVDQVFADRAPRAVGG